MGPSGPSGGLGLGFLQGRFRVDPSRPLYEAPIHCQRGMAPLAFNGSPTGLSRFYRRAWSK